MERISFTFADSEETVEFFVLEQTRINGVNYILVTDSEEDDGEALILKDLSEDGEQDALYEIVEDDDELEAISKIFGQMLDDVELAF
ncbi:MAG: DUF1292 domain-containing protein [Eubacteriales bacterium]|nr:DUF1292 domain-containing protein [Eubacteriales bacterium]